MKTIKANLAYNAAGMAVQMNFFQSNGTLTKTDINTKNGGEDYDWTAKGGGLYSIGIPASGGASFNNDSNGIGWITGIADDVLAFASPKFVFRPAAVNADELTGAQLSAIYGKLPSGNISDFALTSIVDGVQVSKIFEYMMAMFNGQMNKDDPSVGKMTFMKRDNTTVLSIVTKTPNARSRDL